MDTNDGARLLRTLGSLDATGIGTLYAFLESTDVDAIAATVGKGVLVGANGFDERLAARVQRLRSEPHARLVLRVLNRLASTLSVPPRRYATERDLIDVCGEIVRYACGRLHGLDHEFDHESLDGLIAAHPVLRADREPGGSSVRRLVRVFVAQLPEAQRRVLGLGVGAGDVVGLILHPFGAVGAAMQVGSTAYNAYMHYDRLRQRIAIFAVAVAAHVPAGVRDTDPLVTVEGVLRLCAEAQHAWQRAEREVEQATTRLREDNARIATVTAEREAARASRQHAGRRLSERRAALAAHCRERADAIAEGRWGAALVEAGRALRVSRDQLRQCEQTRAEPDTGFLGRVAGSAKQWVEIGLAQQAMQRHAGALLQSIEANDWLRSGGPVDVDSCRHLAAAAAEADACAALDEEINRLTTELASLRQQLGETTTRVSRARAAQSEVERHYLEIQPSALAGTPG
jgi:hypothetical protein